MKEIPGNTPKEALEELSRAYDQGVYPISLTTTPKGVVLTIGQEQKHYPNPTSQPDEENDSGTK